jgi:hypothetical protein
MQDITSFPANLATAWGISTEAAGLILSIGVIMAILLPVVIVARGKKATILEIVALFLGMCVCVTIGWLPSWIIIATVCLMALGVAKLGSDLIGGE